MNVISVLFFFSSRRRHTRCSRDWSSDVCSSDLAAREAETAHESTIRGIRDALENAQAEETALVTQLTACRVEVGSIGERVEALGRELVRADQMEADLTQRLEQGKTRQQQLGERRA